MDLPIWFELLPFTLRKYVSKDKTKGSFFTVLLFGRIKIL